MAERTGNSIKNYIGLVYLTAVTTVMPFIIRTLLVHHLGTEYTGVSSLFKSVIQVLNLANLGIDSAIVFYLYKPVHDGDTERVNAILNLFRRLYIIIGLVMIAIGILCVPLLPSMVKDKTYPADVNILFVYSSYILSTALHYLLIAYRRTLFTAAQRLYIVSVLDGTANLFMYILQIVAIVVFRSFHLYAGLLVSLAVLNTIGLCFLQRKYFPQYRCAGRVSADMVPDFRKRLAAISLARLRNVTRNSIDSLAISMALGLSLLTMYQNYYQVMLVPLMLVYMARGAILPSLGNAVATAGDTESNRGILNLYTFILSGMSTVCLTCLISLFQPFMKLWMGPEYLLPDITVYLFGVYFYAMCLAEIPILLRETTGIWWEGSYVAVLESGANIVLNFVLVRFLGVYGVMIATIVTVLLINLPFEMHYVYRNYFKGGLRSYAVDLLRYTAVTFLITVTSVMICRNVHIVNTGTMLLRIAMSAMLPSAMFLIIYRNHAELKSVIRSVKMVFKRTTD